MTSLPYDLSRSAERIATHIGKMSCFSLAGPGVTRPALTRPYFESLDYLECIAQELDMTVRYDPVGNFIASRVPAGTRCFALGSHVDSVVNGGAYDGTAGVICGFEVARLLPEAPLAVMSFIGEEGSRFGTGLLGSRCVAGEVSARDLRSYQDASGVSFFDAAHEAGYTPELAEECPQILHGLEGYLEIHIEQGRVLEEEGSEIGLVTDIVGMVHAQLEISGRADHAGGTPMNLRSDAGLTAAEVIVELEHYIKGLSTTAVGTVGEVSFYPGARNIIPGLVQIGLDVRDRNLTTIDTILEHIREFAVSRAVKRGQRVTYREDLRSEPVEMDSGVVSGLEAVLRDAKVRYRHMVSGGGHDAMVLAPLVPTGMLFVPCREGLSHSPDEYADPHHLALAAAVAAEYIRRRSA